MLFQTTNLSSPVPITLTANGVYTEPNGLGYSPVIVNVNGGVVGFIKAKYTQGYTCTCSNGQTSLSSDTSGEYVFAVPSTGTWTLSCNGSTATVTISAYGDRKEKAVNLRDELVVSDTEAIVNINDRVFYKTNTEPAVACYISVTRTSKVVFLVSRTENGIKYSTSHGGGPFPAGGTITYSGETWYYSDGNYYLAGSVNYARPDCNLCQITGTEYYSNLSVAAKDLLDYYNKVI